MRNWLAFLPLLASAASVPLDVSAVRPGPVQVAAEKDSVAVRWSDGQSREWQAVFSLDPAKPLIASIGTGGKNVVERASPLYRCETGKRRGGWDAFFDFPPSHPDGTRRFAGDFRLTRARAATSGERVEITFDGLRMGIFEGSIRYVFYPGSRLIQQQAVATTHEPDTAYFYDAGLRMAVDADVRPGNNMDSAITYYDTAGQVRTARPNSSERIPVAVRYRTLAARTGGGSIAVFPAPHQYFFARDYTTNMSNLWHKAWRGNVSLGIRQLPDDDSPYYPWMNAPPGTAQEMSVFFLVSDGDAKSNIDDVIRYTRADKFARLDSFRTFAPHWHLAHTVQALAKGFDWTPAFKPVLKDMGVDAAMIMDFHGDGHPRDLTKLRFDELDAFYKACRAQTDKDFLLIPGEEANAHFGGHWSVAFPKPVYWQMGPPDSESSKTVHPKYGTVYRIGSAKALLEMLRAEKGHAYQTHPRTKGSTGFPDKIRDTEHFRDARYLGAGWKQMPSDLSSPRLGERSLKLLDDMNNWGLRKIIFGEVDVFQVDSTHELYAHMNINYVRSRNLPDFDHYRDLTEAVARGEFFVSTGEVLLPETSIAAAGGDSIRARFTAEYTLPLRFAEVVWGDGAETHRKIFPLDKTREFGRQSFDFTLEAKGWKWARIAVWDVAGDGAFINPVWK
ncbi:MAG: hypothetical protein ABIZ80_23035 [Bryobacteraceae bacterium]